ncbi:MAG: heparinase II/III family protein [Candidatus Latescibacteria bacterium]|nr:heparinase II/III family protein [Candidatus Latescibacterota bacterium]
MNCILTFIGNGAVMKKVSLAVVCFVMIAAFSFSSFSEPVLAPYTYYENFEKGSVGPWASYPPAQDTAYDPSIQVKPLHNVKDIKNRALYREITPNYEIDYEFGVRKLLDLYVTDVSVLTFRSYIKSYRGTEGIRVRFGFSDSTMAELLVKSSETRVWHDNTIHFSEIIHDGSIKKITAVAFMAVCPNADPETLLRFGLDDIKINGMRQLHWSFNEPQVHKLDEWSDFIAGTHFREGESITISGSPPIDVKSVTVKISRALTGTDTKSFIMKRTGDILTCTIQLTDSNNGLGPGFWRATLSPTDNTDDSFTTNLVFLVSKKDAPHLHPKLFISSEDIPDIMAKTTSGHPKYVWEEIQKRARNARSDNKIEDFNYKFDAFNEVHWLPVFGDFGSALRLPQQYIRDNAVVYGMTGDSAAGDAARKALLKVAGWPAYVPPHILNQGKHSYYITGLFLTDLALGYDFIYDRFTPAERTAVADALYSKGIQSVYEEYVKDNWVSSKTSNWICDVTAGSILCSVALLGDYKPQDLEPYLTGSILKLGEIACDPFDENGAYGEGSLYYIHTLHGLTKSMAVLGRMFDVRFPEKIAKSHYFMLYQMDPETKQIYTFGDGYENLMLFGSDSYLSLGNTVYLLGKYNDPYLKWLYDLNPGTTERDLFFAGDTIEGKPPDDLPKTMFFEDIGTTILRSGFSHKDFALIFRCGPFVNHQHFDQGTFFLCDNGENFLGEMGRSDYYDDLWYQKLVTQAGGHNCILVDGNPESQRAGDFLHDVPSWKNYASTTDFLELKGGAFVSGRLDPIYKNKMKLLRRNILFIEPRTAILIDEAIGNSSAKTVDLIFHAPFMEDISITDRKAFITRPSGTLTINTLAPVKYLAGIMRRPMTLNEIRDKRQENMKARGFLQLSTDIGNGNGGTTFVNLLSTDETLNNSLTCTNKSDHCIVTANGCDYYINTSCGKKYTDTSVNTDALIYFETDNGYKAMRVSHIAVNGNTLFSADKPVSVEYTEGTQGRIKWSASETIQIKLLLDIKPKQVLVNDKPFKKWSFSDKNEFEIKLSRGRGEILLQYR